jgi:isoamylase
VAELGFAGKRQRPHPLHAKLAALRHRYPILRHSRFLTAEINEETGVKAVTWINANGSEFGGDEWEDDRTKCFGMVMDGRAQSTGIIKLGADATMLMIMNSWHDTVLFTLPEAPEGTGWQLVVDTNIPDIDDKGSFKAQAVYEVTGRSLLLFEMRH